MMLKNIFLRVSPIMNKRVIIRTRKLCGGIGMIDALFGSKTRVKLLHLFLNNPGQSFYVREITRKIDEQINSVRRELSNMLEVGIITSDSADNKLYYQVNQRYDYYMPLRAIFTNNINEVAQIVPQDSSSDEYSAAIRSISGLRLALAAGILVKGSHSSVDVLLVGNLPPVKVKSAMRIIEKGEGREINYTVLQYEDFYYRLSVRDRFITEIINGKHMILIDKDNILNKS